MERIGVKELKELKAKASEILCSIREERGSYVVTVRGESVAQLTPVGKQGPVDPRAVEAWITGMDELANEIDRLREDNDDVSAVDLVREARRDL